MSNIGIGIAGVIIFIALICLGMRIGFAALLVGIVGLFIILGWTKGIGLVSMESWMEIASWEFAVFPGYILMGYFATYSGAMSDFFSTMQHWLGHLKGGMALCVVIGSIGLGAMTSGGAVACAIMAKIAFPEMHKYGYDDRLTSGAIAAGATMASLIPPSVGLIIYAVLSEQSAAAMLLAGVIPGVLQALVYAVVVTLIVKVRPGWAPKVPKSTWKERFISLKGVWGIFLIVLLMIGGLYGGIFTPTEAGAFGAIGTFVFALARRRINRSSLKESFEGSLMTTGAVLFVLLGVFIFSRFLSYATFTSYLTTSLLSLDVSPAMVIFFVCLIYVVLGMFIMGTAIMMFTLPFMLPIVVNLGYSPIWFGVICVQLIEISQLTPPVAINLFVMKAAAPQVPMQKIIQGVIPFILSDFVRMAVLVAFPAIALWLPKMAGMA